MVPRQLFMGRGCKFCPFWTKFVNEKRQFLSSFSFTVFIARVVAMKAYVRFKPTYALHWTSWDGFLSASLVKERFDDWFNVGFHSLKKIKQNIKIRST